MTLFQHNYSIKTESECNREVRGLSTAHIPPVADGNNTERENTHQIAIEPAKLETWRGASRIKISHEKIQIPQRGGGQRGAVTLFSRQSRKRLLDTLAEIDKTEKPLFLTLTYPSKFAADARVWKNDLEKFYKRMKRKFPAASFIWKLEPQKRGAPHFHLFVWGMSYDALFIWARRAWFETVGSGDEKHLMAGTRVEKVRSWRGVRSYASKYMGKIFDMPMMQDLGWNQPGRFWGVKGRQNLPRVMVTVLEIMSEKQVFDMLRYLRRYSGIKGRKYRSLSIICENPERWEALLQ